MGEPHIFDPAAADAQATCLMMSILFYSGEEEARILGDMVQFFADIKKND